MKVEGQEFGKNEKDGLSVLSKKKNPCMGLTGTPRAYYTIITCSFDSCHNNNLSKAINRN
jgi:hypothetical protein